MELKNLCIFLALIIITAILGYVFKAHDNTQIVENFDNFSNHSVLDNPADIYGQFYSNIYDNLFLSSTKNHFEIYNIKTYTVDNNKNFDAGDIKFLDLELRNGRAFKNL